MPAAERLGNGTKVKVGNSFVGLITNVDPPSEDWESVQTTVMDTEDAHTHIPDDIPDHGTLSVEGFYDPDNSVKPSGGVIHACEVQYLAQAGQTTGAKRTFNAFLTNWSTGARIGELMSFSLEMKITGPVEDVAAV